MTAVSLFFVTSCSEEKLGESIFDTKSPAVDPTSATGDFDQWLYDNFVVPYNVDIQYKFNASAAGTAYQLAPADYEKSQLLARFIKYLFYEVYDKYGEKDKNGDPLFMKKYGPRIFHFIGSVQHSIDGTETLGYASQGVKITLINVNGMNDLDVKSEYTSTDIDKLNKDQFHTMHHEFSHILHQTKSYPVTYGQVTNDTYDANKWQDNDSTKAHAAGYVTHYAMSAATEDFVECLSCVITDNDYRWMSAIIDLCLNGGVKNGDKERVYEFIDSLGITKEVLDDPKMRWNNFTIYREMTYNQQTQKYEPSGRHVQDVHLNDTRNHFVAEDLTHGVRFEADTTFTSFRDYLDKWVQIDVKEGTRGMNAFLKKLEIATKWYTENWGLHLFRIREEVRYRQDHVNDFIKNDVTIFEYK